MIVKLRILIIPLLLAYLIPAYTDISFATKDPSCDVEEEWCPPSAGPLTTWTAPVCGKGKLVVQPFFAYKRARGTFDSEGHYKSFTNKDKKWQWQQQLLVQYGLTDKFEVDGFGEYQENIRQIDGTAAEDHGFSDSYLYLRYCAVEESLRIPCITGIFQLKFPTGKYQKADPDKLGTDLKGATSGGGSYEHGYGVMVTKRIKPFIFHADAIWGFPVETRIDGVNTRYGSYLTYDAGFEYFLPKGFNLMIECNGFSQGDRKDNGRLVPTSDIKYLIISPGIGWSNDAIQTLLAYQRTVAGTNTDVNDTVIFTFVYTF